MKLASGDVKNAIGSASVPVLPVLTVPTVLSQVTAWGDKTFCPLAG